MKIREAYEKGLLIVGEEVKCDGSKDSIIKEYHGTIAYVSSLFLDIERQDKLRGIGNRRTWRVQIDNAYAEIYFNTTMQITVAKQFTNKVTEAIHDGKRKVYVYNKSGVIYSYGKHSVHGSIKGNIITVK